MNDLIEKPASPPPLPEAVKLNLGCGENKERGFLNVDKYAECAPDMVVDLENFPWPWATSSVSEIILNHVLEHLGQTPAMFLSVMKELYRVCRDKAEIRIAVPHPQHDDFLDDPTHVRPITPGLLQLFSKRMNRQIKEMGAANSPLALYTGTDFEIVDVEFNLDPRWQARFVAGEFTSEQIFEMARERRNVVRSLRLRVTVVKPS